MSSIITIKQCLEHMESGQPFSCTVVAYDRRRKKGGEMQEYPEAVLVQAEPEESEAGQRPPTRMEQLQAQISDQGRNPNHRHWYTRNIRLLQDGHPTVIIRKLHPPLLLTFNNQTVVP